MKKNELKGFFLSLLIHSSLIGAVFVYQDESQKVASEEKVVSLDLMSYRLPKKVEETPRPQEKPKPTKKPEPIKKELPKTKEQPKPIKKTEPIKKEKPKEIKKEPKPHKPIEHKKEEPTPQVAKEVVKKPMVEKTIQKKEITKQVKDESTSESKKRENPAEIDHEKIRQAEKQAFIKTNFAIIRDMVLSDLSYPKVAKRMGWEGVVEVELQVDEKGTLLHVKLAKSSGKKALDEAAIKAALKLKIKKLPKPKSTTIIILPISFNLR